MLILAKNTTVFRARNDNEHSLFKEWNNYANTKHTPLLLEKFKCKNVDAETIQKMECEYSTKINSSEYQKLKQRIENGFQGFDASGSTAPPSDKSSAGRCNPEGVSYLYAALEEHTAVAEIRPHIKDTISIATLKTIRDLKLIDLDYNPLDTVKGKDFLFNDIQREFSLINKGNSKEYLITQYITALIEHLGYDGLCFRSSLVKDGTNYVIFNPNDCCVLSSKLCFLSEVSYTYNQCI